MAIKEFNKEIAKREGGNKQVNIGQINEISKIINEMTNGIFYKFVKTELYKDKVFIRMLKLALILCFRVKK